MAGAFHLSLRVAMMTLTFRSTRLKSTLFPYLTRHSLRVNRATAHVWLLSLLAVVAVIPAEPVLAADQSAAKLKLVELYTSHGCSSCPSADALLGELLEENEDLLALEFHVDYWDNLVHGNDGNFVDPFSQARYSARQREYNTASLSGRPGVYTPQAIVNGRFAAVGSNRQHITRALATDQKQALQIQVSAGQTPDTLNIAVTGNSEQLTQLAGTDIRVAHYIDQVATYITGGENRDKTLVNHNIVKSLKTLGEVSASAEMSFSIEKPADDGGCVILVQEDALTPIYAAHACP
ncbi:MAG: DUF1223 domain-containing protein [Granulosicoccus sp.]